MTKDQEEGKARKSGPEDAREGPVFVGRVALSATDADGLNNSLCGESSVARFSLRLS